MIISQEIENAIEKIAPLSFAYEWDNCGLLVGSHQKPVSRILTCLDCDMDIVQEAKEIGADMILSHHPFFFYEKKRYTDDDYYMRVLKELFRLDINYYAAHTNMDIAPGGLNDLLGQKIGLTSPVDVLESVCETAGIGRIYELKTPITIQDLCTQIKKGLGISHIAYTGRENRMVRRIGLCSGGGQSLADAALEKECEVYITGDVRHDPARDYLRRNMSLILIRHYDSEQIIKELYHTIITNAFQNSVEVVASQIEKPIFQTFEEKE